MESTLELSELDGLVERLDARISSSGDPETGKPPSLLLCSGYCGDEDASWFVC
ncbi:MULTISPECIES: hypothetical protein [Amycolatopsis]|uniref:SapB/AmfS family lantipeptide n=1 Tax=Amycolatopsis tucumanensis TaxID=401106 RepID=A0ABP7JI44_9PSEU|nr:MULTISPECIES: hypothetical protein [Amycolatopsis]MCF6425199.1 hypothetical protein [Amycolatopsis tucumanensis]